MTDRASPLEFLLLRTRLTEARREVYGPNAAGFREFELGLTALTDATQLASSRSGRDTALLLYRAAIRLLACATVLRRGESADPLPWSEVWSSASSLPGWPTSELPMWLSQGVIHDEGERYLAALPAAEREPTLESMRALTEQLATPLQTDATLVSRALWTRRLRLGGVALVAVLALCIGVSRLIVSKNLALHRPVVVSDRDPTYGVDPSQVVDGDETNLGFHTSSRAHTTVTVDLGAVKPLTRVEIFNRPDCCQERAAPLSLELSSDGTNFKTVARKPRTFQQWTATLPPGTSARYVRIEHERTDFFHLSEIEVF